MPESKETPTPLYRIREAVPEDAVQLGRVHVDSWRTTYRGLLPQVVLDHQSYENRAQNWHAVLTARVDQGFVYVAERPDPRGGSVPQIVGLASGGFERTENKLYDGELYAIYLLEEVQKQGIGRRLVYAVAQRLLRDGYKAMLVWALRENPARGFYEALGGQYLFEQEISIGPADAVEVAYGWKDLRQLIATCEAGI